jgi:hypothetical protein
MYIVGFEINHFYNMRGVKKIAFLGGGHKIFWNSPYRIAHLKLNYMKLYEA